MPVPPLSHYAVLWNIDPDDTPPPPISRPDPVLAPWLPDSLPLAQYERLHATLKRLADDANGLTLLRAYATWAEVKGATPNIVWREKLGQRDDQSVQQDAPIGAQGGVGWLVDLDHLENATVADALKTLGESYGDMTQMRTGDPYASLPAEHHLLAMDPALEASWDQWLSSPPDACQRKARARAIQEIRTKLVEMRCYGGLDVDRFRWLLTELRKARPNALPVPASLDLSYLGLDSIPPMPSSIDALNLSGNILVDWSNMPKSLRALELRRHRGTWPDPLPLPADLVELDLTDSNLENAPPHFLNALQALNGLTSLLLSNTSMDTLPALGTGVRSLDITGNRFRAIPANLPPGVVFLYAAHNPLESLPARREDLPATLRMLNVRPSSTPDLEVPEALGYSRDLSIDLAPGTEAVGQRAIRFRDLPVDRVPSPAAATVESEILLRVLLRFLLTSAEGASATDLRRYREAADQWDEICRQLFTSPSLGDDIHGLAPVLPVDRHPSSDEPTAFYIFLSRLEQVPAFRKHEDFRRGIRDWLVDLATRKSLRDTTLGVCMEANETCSDRLILAYNRLMMHRLGSDIEEGRLDEDIPRVIDIARQVYTLEVLTDVADRMVRELRRNSVEVHTVAVGRSRASSRLHGDAIGGFDGAADGRRLDAEFIGSPEALRQLGESERRIDLRTGGDFVLDEVEIHLAILCLVCAPDALDLRALAPERMTFESTQIDGQSIKGTVMTEVQRRGEQEFLSFLALDYAPWTSLLKRKAAQAYAQAEARQHDALTRDFDAAVDAEVQALGLEAGAGTVLDEARKDAGRKVARRLQLEALLPVTLGMLKDASKANAPITLPFGAGAHEDAPAPVPVTDAWQRV